MRILIGHNYYQQAGGEDQVFAAEADLLESKGHDVYRYTLHNNKVDVKNPIALLEKTVWNADVYQTVRSLIRREGIQVAHFHNTFPLMSPSAYYAAKAEGIPVIQTTHNYRLLCPNALFFRDGKVCEDCLGKPIPLPGIQHGCYRNSRTASAAVAAMLTLHRAIQTWSKQVDTYVALTEFARQKLIQGGFPAEKIVVKPNFVNPDPGYGDGQGGYALFVGRLSPEKGIDTLIAAWEQLGSKIPLKIVGDGPMADLVAEACIRVPGITWLGRRPMVDVYTLLQSAMFLVFPSKWYEGMPRTLIEAFATGTPVLASNLGSMSTLVKPERTGWHFAPGNVEELVSQVELAIAHPDKLSKIRKTARAEFENNYTAEKSYQRLLDIYHQGIPAYPVMKEAVL